MAIVGLSPFGGAEERKVGNIYTAEHLAGLTKPEVILHLEVGKRVIEFRLSEEAQVRIVRVGHPSGRDMGKWGDLQGMYQLPAHLVRMRSVPIKVEVLKDVWDCSPNEILQCINDLTNKVSRRNRQITDLRKQLAAAKQR